MSITTEFKVSKQTVNHHIIILKGKTGNGMSNAGLYISAEAYKQMLHNGK